MCSLFFILSTVFGVATHGYAQVRHYSRDEVPSVDELREVLARPVAPSSSHPRARSKAWVQDGLDDERQDAPLAARNPASSAPAEVAAARKPHVPAPAAGQPKGEISIEIVFKLNSDELEGRYVGALGNVAQALIETSQPILVEGHTDASGSPELNAGLSIRRANSVKAFLVGKGVSSSLISTRGVGANKLLDRENPFAAVNRRVVFSAL